MAYNVQTDLWNINSTPAAATQATATRAAAAAGIRHVAKRIAFSVATIAATAQTPIGVNLRDGATGAGTILWSFAVACLGTTNVVFDFDNLQILGTAATAMTIEFAVAGVANSLCTVNAQGYDLP